MSYSSLASYKKLSPNYSKRTGKISKITIHHCAVVNATLQGLGNGFAQPSRKASSNYGIDSAGRIGVFVEEEYRAWTSSSAENDNVAITIEVSNSTGAPEWRISDAAMQALIKLCVDICKRNDIKELNFTGDKSGNLTMHKWFAATNCPGAYLESKFPYIAAEVNKQLKNNGATANNSTIYKVQVGAFKNRNLAENLLKKLKAQGYTDAFIKQSDG